jgi:hypothetical protein
MSAKTRPFPKIGTSLEEVATILVVSPQEEDHVLTRAALDHGNWRLLQARGFRQGVVALRQTPVHIVVSGCDLDQNS